MLSHLVDEQILLYRGGEEYGAITGATNDPDLDGCGWSAPGEVVATPADAVVPIDADHPGERFFEWG